MKYQRYLDILLCFFFLTLMVGTDHSSSLESEEESSGANAFDIGSDCFAFPFLSVFSSDSGSNEYSIFYFHFFEGAANLRAGLGADTFLLFSDSVPLIQPTFILPHLTHTIPVAHNALPPSHNAHMVVYNISHSPQLSVSSSSLASSAAHHYPHHA